MSNAKIAGALVGGYLLGRTKKAKFAVRTAMWLTGRKYNAQDILRDQVVTLLRSEEGQQIIAQLRGPAADAVRQALLSAYEAQAERLADGLHGRLSRLVPDAGGNGREESGAEDVAGAKKKLGGVGKAATGTVSAVAGAVTSRGRAAGDQGEGAEDERAEDETPQDEQYQQDEEDQAEDGQNEQDAGGGGHQGETADGDEDEAAESEEFETAQGTEGGAAEGVESEAARDEREQSKGDEGEGEDELAEPAPAARTRDAGPERAPAGRQARAREPRAGRKEM
ncbi:conserved hypothetical protein [Frankia canadensis]|uniref:DNA primase n=1 Tax=Frankia canadensis TaxID=1836972 RepID=A0A2I2KN87_9ACTN|nr:hypothetical protein [Frankia canadensis]SNQ47137.1 conserved hypothetical protein [Frankia canadensis]SOU54427.1 conserved hypothetical protein [Frankia canadensis]